MKKFLQNLPKLGRGLDTSRNVFGGTLEGLLDQDFEDMVDGDGVGSEPGIPSAVQRFIEYLRQECVLNREGIFRLAGSSALIAQLRDEIERTNVVDFSATGEREIPSICGLFKQFLRELSDGVIPRKCFQAFADAGDSISKIKQAITQIPQPNLDVLFYICRYLLLVAENEPKNKMGIPNLVIVFAPNLFRCPSEKGTPEKFLVESMQASKAMGIMLDKFHDVFDDDALSGGVNGIRVSPTKMAKLSKYASYKKNSPFSSGEVLSGSRGQLGSMTAIEQSKGRNSVSSSSNRNLQISSINQVAPASPYSPHSFVESPTEASREKGGLDHRISPRKSEAGEGDAPAPTKRDTKAIPMLSELKTKLSEKAGVQQDSFLDEVLAPIERNKDKDDELLPEQQNTDKKRRTSGSADSMTKDAASHVTVEKMPAPQVVTKQRVPPKPPARKAPTPAKDLPPLPPPHRAPQIPHPSPHALQSGSGSPLVVDATPQLPPAKRAVIMPNPRAGSYPGTNGMSPAGPLSAGAETAQQQQQSSEPRRRSSLSGSNGSLRSSTGERKTVTFVDPTLSSESEILETSEIMTTATTATTSTEESSMIQTSKKPSVPASSSSMGHIVESDHEFSEDGNTSTGDELHSSDDESSNNGHLMQSQQKKQLVAGHLSNPLSPESPASVQNTAVFHNTMDAVISGNIELIPLGQGRVKEAAQRISRSLTNLNEVSASKKSGSNASLSRLASPTHNPSSPLAANSIVSKSPSRATAEQQQPTSSSNASAELSDTAPLPTEMSREDSMDPSNIQSEYYDDDADNLLISQRNSVVTPRASIISSSNSHTSNGSKPLPHPSTLTSDAYKSLRAEGKQLAQKIRLGKQAGLKSIQMSDDIKRFRELKAYLQDHPPVGLQVAPPQLVTSDNSIAEPPSQCQLALQRLDKQRKREGRPYDVMVMNAGQLNDEKSAVRKELGALKALFASRDGTKTVPTKDDRTMMRELYQRYCEVKDRLASLDPLAQVEGEETEDQKIYKQLRSDKRQLQVMLHNFQEQFKKENGRNIQTSVDREPVAAEYKRYKEIKEQIKEIEEKLGISATDESSTAQ
ncbi:hypothetical protein SmJEL517_g01089 [Synchytrium microbalum]|uniref:Rho-GAP domain-containing protein n=1 Tax=Synchytrium microbalum TaxID=1806994 RepID=A0A507CG43_9FUNG|nr:uncharacterized protein SmJEL517_g01089 [Synchytrium microbalum]TPX36914.1 hypothetical protein SmJEL517_g01089 [Synchytrium microbalum]